MFTDHIETAIAAASSTGVLVELSAAVWKTHAAGSLPDAQAQRLAELIEAKKVAAKATQKATSGSRRFTAVYQPRRTQRPPVRSVAIERRRSLAASGVMPPALASRFTTSELACLRIVADEVRQHGSCRLFLDAIAARAGTSRSTAKNALREARRLGLVEIAERRQHGAKSLSNIVTIVDREWSAWLKRGPRIGGKKVAPTDTVGFRMVEEAGSSRQILARQSHALRSGQKPKSGSRAIREQ